MNPRRKLLIAGAALGASLPGIGPVMAQEFPSRSIRIIVPYAPGGAADFLARLIGQEMTRMFGQSVVIENRPGASGTTGSEMVARTAPDGYNLVMGTSASHSVNTIAIKDTYDPVTAFSPVALVTRAANVIVAHPSFEAQTIADLIRLLKAKPGTPMATAGPATSGRFAAELMMARLDVKITLVPYKSSAPAIADVMAGHTPLGITDALAPTPMIRNGTVRAIAVTSAKRVPSLPDVPTLAETVAPGFEAVAWNALFAPPGTPAAVLSKLNRAVVEIVNQPDNRKRIEALGQEIAVGSPQDLTNFIKADIAKWKDIAARNQLQF
jgi:tripartite-type tricarboxylate transporter receptor subunit TctC